MNANKAVHILVLTVLVLGGVVGTALAWDGTDPHWVVRNVDPTETEAAYPVMPTVTARPPKPEATATPESAYPPPGPIPTDYNPTPTTSAYQTPVPTIGALIVEVKLGVSGKDSPPPPFSPGQSIYLFVAISALPAGGNAEIEWQVSGPCDFKFVQKGTVYIDQDTAILNVPMKLPGGSCGGNYLYKVSVSYLGKAGGEDMIFEVRE